MKKYFSIFYGTAMGLGQIRDPYEIRVSNECPWPHILDQPLPASGSYGYISENFDNVVNFVKKTNESIYLGNKGTKYKWDESKNSIVAYYGDYCCGWVRKDNA